MLIHAEVYPPATLAFGQQQYLERCASCHGVDFRGGPLAPSLRGVGAAGLDFMMSTGRMPAAVPWIEVAHRAITLPQPTIDAIVAYVDVHAAGGPPIPVVMSNGNAVHGAALYQQNCMHCHGVDAEGAAIGGDQWAPSLEHATVLQVAEAIRVGPYQMPRFSVAQLDDQAVDDIVTFLSEHNAPATPKMPFRSSGPVLEGLIGWLLAALLVAAVYLFTRSSRGTSS